MAQENTASQQIYDLLVTRDFDPKSLDSMGKPTVNPSEADLFSFNFAVNGNEYGTVVVLINGDNDLEVYYGDNLGKGMDPGDRGDWYDFLAMLRQTAKRNLLTFSLNNMNKLKYQMASMADISESLVMEAWRAQGKSKSYSNQPGKAKVVIQHSRAIGEGEQRFRNIASLFVENAQGERFRMPFESIAGAKAMARHVSEGGTPYDAFGHHISETINEIKTLGKFVRASRSNAFAQNEQALGIVEDAVKHYADLKRKAKKMIGKRGYKEIFSNYDPAIATELDETIESVREVFVNSAVDSRIEEALPILAKIKESTMKEANQFENWTNQIMEGTWALPETAEDMARLQELMSKPLPAGPDGEYATEQLYSLIGDDSLFDDISELADKDPDADVREVVMARAKELGVDIDVEVAENMNENPTDQETASGYQAGQANAAAGKERSMAMNLGGEKAAMKQTAGGQDIEEDSEEMTNTGREEDLSNIDRDSITIDMVKPAILKMYASYTADAKEWNDRYAELEKEVIATGVRDPRQIEVDVLNMDDDIISYTNIDDLEDKIDAIKRLMKQGDADGHDIVDLASSGPSDTIAREEFMRELKTAIKQDHPEVYDKLFMYGIGESVSESVTDADLYSTDKDSVIEIMKQYPEDAKKMRQAGDVYAIYGSDLYNEFESYMQSDGGIYMAGSDVDPVEVINTMLDGYDLLEGMDSFVNPNDQDATRSKTNVPTKNLDSEDMTENRLSREELDIDDEDMANLMSADELRKELIADLNHLYDQAAGYDFVDNDHIIDEMGDYFNDIHINGDEDVVEVYTMARDLVDAEIAEVINMTEKGIKGLGGIIEDAAMSDMRRLSGQVVEKKHVKKETQDSDTGKQALKAERDPMLERIMSLSGR